MKEVIVLNLLDKIKYTYMFIYLLILISSFLIISLKITYCVLPLLNDGVSPYYYKTKNRDKLKQFIKIIPFSILGILISIVIYSLLDNTMLIQLSRANL